MVVKAVLFEPNGQRWSCRDSHFLQSSIKSSLRSVFVSWLVKEPELKIVTFLFSRLYLSGRETR